MKKNAKKATKEWFTVTEMAKQLGISKNAVYTRAKVGSLRRKKGAKGYVFSAKSMLDTMLDALAAPVEPVAPIIPPSSEMPRVVPHVHPVGAHAAGTRNDDHNDREERLALAHDLARDALNADASTQRNALRIIELLLRVSKRA